MRRRDARGERGRFWVTRVAAGSTALAAIALATMTASTASMTGCNEAPTFKADRSFTSTVTLSNETALVIDSVLPLTVNGEARSSELYLHVDATVTASTSTRAKALAASLSVGDQTTDRTKTLTLAAPSQASLSGTFTVDAPAELDLSVIDRGGTADVSGMTGDIRVYSLSHARITGARGSVEVGVSNGNALVDTTAAAGTTTKVKVDRGDIQLSLPSGLSADITALSRSGGIYIDHPRLPASVGEKGLPYQATVGGGLATIRLETGAGNIVIRTR